MKYLLFVVALIPFSIPIWADMGIEKTIPQPHQSSIVLHSPKPNQVLIKPQVLIKGINRYATPVFLNGERLEVGSDGRFFKKINIETLGQSQLLFSVVVPGEQLVHFSRDLIRLDRPATLNVTDSDHTKITYFYNTRLMPQDAKNRSVDLPIRRQDLAYFLDQLMANKVSTINETAVDRLKAAGVMTEYPDGEFYPENLVTRLDYIVGLVRALKLSPEKEPIRRSSWSVKDLDYDHWASPYVQAAKMAEAMPDKRRIYPKKQMTLRDLVVWASHLPSVQSELSGVAQFMPSAETGLMAWAKKAENYAEQTRVERQESRQLSVDSPQDRLTTEEDGVFVQGNVYPATEIYINKKKIIPEFSGQFRYYLPLKPGRNEIRVQGVGQIEKRVVFQTQLYSDLDGHWIGQTAEMLKLVGVLPKGAHFRPNHPLTKQDFANWIHAAWALIPEIESVPSASIMAEFVSRGIVQDSRWKMPLRKGEAVAMYARAFSPILNGDLSTQTWFRDVPQSHWVYPYLMTCVQSGTVSPGRRFKPKARMTRAQGAAMLAKLEPVKTAMMTAKKTDP